MQIPLSQQEFLLVLNLAASMHPRLDLSLPLALQAFLSYELKPQERILCLQHIMDHPEEYTRPLGFTEQGEAELLLVCRCLIYFNTTISRLLENEQNREWYDALQHNEQCREWIYQQMEKEQPFMEYMLYLHALPDMDPADIVAYSEGFAYCIHANNKTYRLPEKMYGVYCALKFRDRLESKDIIDFCRHLSMGESVRLHELGLIGERERKTVDNFLPAQRNPLLLRYIDLRLPAIKAELDNEGDRTYPPTEADYLKELLQEEESAVDRERSIDHFRGLSGYEILHYEGRFDLIKMSSHFLRIVKDKIQALEVPAPQPYIEHYYEKGAVHNDHCRNVQLDPKETAALLKELMREETQAPAAAEPVCDVELFETYLTFDYTNRHRDMLDGLMEIIRQTTTPKDQARIAYAILCSKAMKSQYKHKKFAEWYSIMCEIFGWKKAKYDPCKLTGNKLTERVQMYLPR